MISASPVKKGLVPWAQAAGGVSPSAGGVGGGPNGSPAEAMLEAHKGAPGSAGGQNEDGSGGPFRGLWGTRGRRAMGRASPEAQFPTLAFCRW